MHTLKSPNRDKHISRLFRTMRNDAERKENHTLTVREGARMFEAAGVARTERSSINWCQPNKTGVARLDCYFDPNDRKYFVTPQSVEMAIAEEKAKAAKTREPISETPLTIRDHLESPSGEMAQADSNEETPRRTKALEQELLDLRITNRAKDMFIEQLKNERESFAEERGDYVEKLMTFDHRVGELETRLLQIGPPGVLNSSVTDSAHGNGDDSNGSSGLPV